jgi:hypothetical protein
MGERSFFGLFKETTIGNLTTDISTNVKVTVIATLIVEVVWFAIKEGEVILSLRVALASHRTVTRTFARRPHYCVRALQLNFLRHVQL